MVVRSVGEAQAMSTSPPMLTLMDDTRGSFQG